jgi:hypothetical protein
MDDGYQGLPRSDKWSCLVAALVGGPVFLFLLGMDALGDCAPDTSCRKGFWLMVFAPSLLVTLLVFAGVRAIVRRNSGGD